MDASTRATGSFQHHIRFAALIIVFVIAGIVLILIGQFAALALLPLIALLLFAVDRRDRRAQALAARITDDRHFEKLEVPHGSWGDLARAVNGLLQDRRVEQRLRAALPSPLPLEAVQSLLGGDLATGGKRPVRTGRSDRKNCSPSYERSGLYAAHGPEFALGPFAKKGTLVVRGQSLVRSLSEASLFRPGSG